MVFTLRRHLVRKAGSTLVLAGLCAVLPFAAQAQDHGDPHGTPPPHDGYPPHGGAYGHGAVYGHGGGYAYGWGYHGYGHVTVVDRGRPGWWRGSPGFVGYVGVRPGYDFAPGYGYYAVPAAYAHTAWVAGATLPPPMRRYVVVEPAAYGLRPPPPGYGWYYAGANFVLVAAGTGVIVQSIAGGW